MTLIIASVRPRDVILTSDSRSVLVNKGVVTGIDDRYQKLFPVPEHPIVIAHMGQNLLGGMPIKRLVSDFLAHLNVGDLTILQIADRLRDYAHAVIRTTFNEISRPLFGVNFWVAGFSCHEEKPGLVEVFWKQTGDILTTEERHFTPTCVVPGGSGAGQIDKVDWHQVDGKSVDDVRAYHHALMDQAINAKVEHNEVGGAIHELLITPADWRWTQGPPG